MKSKAVAEQYNNQNEQYRKQREAVWPEVSLLPETMLLKLIRDHFKDNDSFSLLDVGCAYGADLLMVRNSLGKDFSPAMTLSGIDVSSWMAEETRKAGFECRDGDFMALDAEQENWDCVWCNMCLMHFSLSETSSALDKLKAFIKPGGLLGVGVKAQPAPLYGLGVETINPAHGSISEDRVMTYFCEPAFRDLLLSDGGFRFMGHITLPSRSLSYNYSWVFVKRD